MTYDKLDDIDEFAHPPGIPLAEEIVARIIDGMNAETDKRFLDLIARIAEPNLVRSDGRAYGAQ